MYRALYRKYRPQKFADVVGQEAITTALQNQIQADKVGHAYLFTGTHGTGKTTCAKIFAKAVNCENPQGVEPCGECVSCKGMEDGSILDVTEIDAASNNSVDDIRDLRDETAYRPSRGRYKIYIVDEVHMLSASAFNALLKIMEEPPSHIIFILATTEIHKVPATILSRCQRYDFIRIQTEKIAARLAYVAQQEDVQLTEQAAELIARLADGAMRDALSLLDTCAGIGGEIDEALVRRMAGVADKSYLFAISSAVSQQNVVELMGLVNALREQSIDVKRLCEELVYHYRNFILAAADKTGKLLHHLPEQERNMYVQDSQVVDEQEAIKAVRRLVQALDRISRAPDPRIELELALFDMAVPVQETVQVAPKPQPTAPARVVQPVALPVPRPMVVEEAPASKQPVEVEQLAEEMPAEPVPVRPVEKPADGEIILFEPWQDIVAHMEKENRMLYNYMKQSTAYYNGKHVLIDGGQMFLSYMRDYAEAGESIKKAIYEVTGSRYNIGPYTAQEGNASKPEQKPVTAQDTLRDWEAKGVPIKYE